MSTRNRLAILAVFLFAAVLAGCGSGLPPRPLTAAQRSFLAQAPRLGVVAVTVPQPDYGHAKILRGILERTQLFAGAVLLDSAGASTPYTATIDDRCSCRHGGWIPILPILTLGIVPQFNRCALGYAFTLREAATGQETRIGCDIKVTYGVGWLPALMNVLPGWTLDDTESGDRFESRLAYSIATAIRSGAPPSAHTPEPATPPGVSPGKD